MHLGVGHAEEDVELWHCLQLCDGCLAARLEKVALCCANAGHLAHRSLGQVVGQQLALVGPRHQHVVLQRKKKKNKKPGRQVGGQVGGQTYRQTDGKKGGQAKSQPKRKQRKQRKQTVRIELAVFGLVVAGGRCGKL